jgi:hypothetical protein
MVYTSKIDFFDRYRHELFHFNFFPNRNTLESFYSSLDSLFPDLYYY